MERDLKEILKRYISRLFRQRD